MNIGEEGIDWEWDENGKHRWIDKEYDESEPDYPEHGDIGYGYYEDYRG